MFLKNLNLKFPLVVAPMAGGPSTTELVIASSTAGALGSVGAAYSTALDIEDFVEKVREKTSNPIAINLFISTQPPVISDAQVLRAIKATEKFRTLLGISAPTLKPPYEENFDEQFEMVLKLKPAVLSFVFGLLKPEYVRAAQKRNIQLFGTATTFEEAQALEDSGVEAITLQGVEGGGHRGIFDPQAEDKEVTLFQLLEQCQRKIKIPLIAAGGIMTSVDISKALNEGAAAVQMGTAFLLCEEAGTSDPYKRALSRSLRKTKTTRAFSGRLARGIENPFMLDLDRVEDGILPFPAQNKFTRDIRTASAKSDSSDCLSLWAGAGEGTLWSGPAEKLILSLFGN